MHRVALVVPGFEFGGGVPTVALFLERILRDSGRYRVDFVSLPMGRDDEASVRLLAPSTWRRGVLTRSGSWEGRAFTCVGAVASELEFQRYRPRRALTRRLDSYDLVQIVAGSPAWGHVARGARPPVALQVATRVAEERRAQLARASGPGHWRRALATHITTRMELSALRHVDVVFVENRWMLEELERVLPPDRLIFAPPGVDTDLFRPATAPPPAPGVILSVGRFADPRKRVDLLFRAYAELCATMSEAPRLQLAGLSAPTRESWRVAEQLGVRDRIEFRESATTRELIELYRSARVLALASDEEGLGLVLLEAMACGLPVVSTACGGPETAVRDGENGYLVPTGDTAALASRLRALLEDEEQRQRMGRCARERAVERFSLAVAGQPFLAWYERALAAPARGVGGRR